MNSNVSRVWVWVGIAVIIIVAFVWWLYGQSSSVTPAIPEPAVSAENQTQPASGTTPTSQAAPTAPMAATVTYDGTSFSPAQVTVALGGTVTFVDTSGRDMWVASNPHPTHQGYSGTTRSQHCPDTAGVAFDQCKGGTSYSFTFRKAGTWGYHDHYNDSASGEIVVTPQ